MSGFFWLRSLFLGLSLAACSMTLAPKAQKTPHLMEIHNDQRTDPYFWLRQKDHEDVLKYLQQENDYALENLKPTQALQKELFQEMRSRILEKDQSVPVFIKPYLYYVRYEENAEYPIFCRRLNSMENTEEVYFDPNEMSKKYDYFQLGQVDVSPNHEWLAFSFDRVGRRIYDIQIQNIKEPTLQRPEIRQVSGNFVWANDNDHFFFTKKNLETLRDFQIARKKLSTNEPEVLIFEEKDPTFYVHLSKSLNEKLIFIESHSTLSNETLFLSADQPLSSPQIFHPREEKHEYEVIDGGDRFFILTNWNAKNFRLMESPHRATSKTEWKEVIAHDEKVLLENVEVFESFIASEERENGLTRIRVLPRDQLTETFLLKYDDPVYVTGLGDHGDFQTKKLRYTYESPTTPPSVFEMDLTTKQRTLLKEKQVLGGFDKNNYEAKRLFAPARDGSLVPISMVYRKDKLQKPQSLLLYGYGSYGLSLDPHFGSNILSLLDRGFIFAQAHIRGGSEMGRPWYEKGKLFNKKNTFYDFIDSAEFLIKENWSSPEKLYAMGGSAGGLLMGAVMNMRPDLFKAIVAQVPFVDVLTTMLDESIPLTTFEYDEWGNPNDPKFYEYIKSYSPYDNVEAKNYPHLFVNTGYHDSQVQYWEPAKWVAKLRDLKTDQNLLIFHTEMSAGHSGKAGRFKSLEDRARDYAFVLGIDQGLIP
ncbi:MAG: S9 family peptidase [Bdellovibrionota bacterium]